MGDASQTIRAELARQGIVVSDDDLAAIVSMVTANRAALVAALATVRAVGDGGEPEAAHGFLPPAPADAPPR
jgi:hypothetical protein